MFCAVPWYMTLALPSPSTTFDSLNHFLKLGDSILRLPAWSYSMPPLTLSALTLIGYFAAICSGDRPSFAPVTA